MRRFLALLAVASITILPLQAQAPQSLKLVRPQGSGSITFALTGGWRPQLIDLLDDGTRPTLQLANDKTKLDLSFILFPNPGNTPTADACRQTVMTLIATNLNHNVKLQNQLQTTRKLKDGRTLAISSYLIASAGDIPLQQQNVFGFLGNAQTCAEIHLSLTRFHPADQPLFDGVLDNFDFDPAYTPTSLDYAAIGAIFYSATQNYPAAALYYRRALDTAPSLVPLPTNGDPRAYTRYLTDQLSMSYGLSGDTAKSRAVNEAAIAQDPLYPLYYYNLACADAEEGHAAAARNHLEQAFARRANTLPGEHLPDPAKDDSILKLKDDKDFWIFVQSLPKN